MVKKEKNKSKEPENVVGTFPKIGSEIKIKDVVFNQKGPTVHFGKFEISERQADLFKELAKSGEKVSITISPIQGRLPGTV